VIDGNRYPAQVFWSDEDGGFIAIAPDLPGCSAFGETQQEALAELHDAIDAWIEGARAAGNPIPEPSDPAKDGEYSGKLLHRMPRDLHARLARLAKSETVSLNHYVVYLLTWASTYRSIEIAGVPQPVVAGAGSAVYSMVSAERRTTADFGRVSVGTTAGHQYFYSSHSGRSNIAFAGGASGIAIASGTTIETSPGGALVIRTLRQEARHG
jgi:prepilin-type processing-associated H-X9-DG protein